MLTRISISGGYHASLTLCTQLTLYVVRSSASFVLRVYAVMQRDFFGIFGVVLLTLIGVLAVVLDIVRFLPSLLLERVQSIC